MAKKGSSNAGIANGAKTLGMLIFIAALIFAWIKINDIHTAKDGYEYFRSWGVYVRKCGIENLEWNCEYEEQNNNSSINYPNSPDNPLNTDASTKVDPNKPDLSKEVKVYIESLQKVKVGDATNSSYNRAEWKHWTGVPCNTRIKVLERDGKDVKVEKYDDFCRITSGSWWSPYDNKTFNGSRDLDIDHVVPLNYAAQHGGQNWPAEKKEAFANDMSQLVAVSAVENRSKGDKGPHDYMPPNNTYQCSYAKIWVNTTTKYGLTITQDDKNKLTEVLQKCK